ncbi:hypothetical protein BJX96DRAFT_44988 [Aspergillus floccosus]
MSSQGSPLFIAQEALCFYPISTIYNSCPRYLFYALLLASCMTRWTGWLTDVFLGTAATYAGVAAIQAFILIASVSKPKDVEAVTIPYLPTNTSIRDAFPQLVTGTNQVVIQPGALELDGDAVLAVVVTGYLVFLPLQCWSRVLSKERVRVILFSLWNLLMLAGSICGLVYSTSVSKVPTQYMFCYPDYPPFEQTKNDGWHSEWRNTTWNSSVWDIFSSPTLWNQLGDLCFNPCFNSSQVLRQQTSLTAFVQPRDDNAAHPHSFWAKLAYSSGYIYSLIAVSVILNCILLCFRLLPFRSRIPALKVVTIWKERKDIWNKLKSGAEKARNMAREKKQHSPHRRTLWSRLQGVVNPEVIKQWASLLIDVILLVAILLSIIISPFTVIAFVVWIEWCIYNDGPAEEHPQQVGQWSYLVSIGLLLLSAVILRLRYRVSSAAELDRDIEVLRRRLVNLEARREAYSEPGEEETNGDR